MADISKIDKNFEVKTSIEKENIKFYSIDENPFSLHGIFKENGKYRRLPENVAKNTSEGVFVVHTNTAGGRVRFATDSGYIAIYAKMSSVGKMSHFALTGSMGFDLYADGRYTKTFVPPFQTEDGFESKVEFNEEKKREITINFPLYSDVDELYIGIDETKTLEKASPYKSDKPVVYYGSSITQGGCASRPGTSYPAIISRRFDCDYINLGFSGSAKAEDSIIDYIKKLDMSLFVYDYDHNAPTAEHLFNTHEKMFKAIREKNPDIPIIMMTRPKIYLNDEEKKRREIIEATYKNAVNNGDKNVYFIDGEALCVLCGNEGTVDRCHPTDFGFASMAKALGDVIEKHNIAGLF